MSALRTAPAVVVGIDGSRAATHAALWAIDEAVKRDIPLRLVYVIDPSETSAAGGDGGRQSAARAALYEAYRAVDAMGRPVKIETEILRGRPLTKLMHESRSAAMLCVGSVGLNHVRRGRGSVAATLAGSALCPVAVILPDSGGPATPQVSEVVTEVDNGGVLRHAFEEARLRGVPVRAVAAHVAETPEDVEDGNRLAQAQLSRRLARWTRLYPDVRVESAIVRGSACRHLAANAKPGQLFVTDSRSAHELCGAYQAGCSVLTVRSANL
ncbi:universal stress protein [Mycobacterium decipiens]|uniref:Universal stress protein n=1 Tax=Mycobacterium decipiens TaxID=1430326 RepID=A0A1X2M0S4_9MYCO|nr:universal stress protein [Mycobacterium decipiens]OSC43214.1 universal stress protein [Mycobacterium decipiens]